VSDGFEKTNVFNNEANAEIVKDLKERLSLELSKLSYKFGEF